MTVHLAVASAPESVQYGVVAGPIVQLGVKPGVSGMVQVTVILGKNIVVVQLVVEQTTVLKMPAHVLLQETVPVGVIGIPGDVSVTVTTHRVGRNRATVLGLQLTLVEVLRCVTVRLKVFELPEWVGSPL